MKNILKRLLCLVISLAVCTGTAAFAADSGEQSQLSKKMTTAMYFLRELDIIGDYFDYNTDTAEKITRAEFCDVMVKALNIENTGKKDTYFYDVPLSHYACDQINTLAEMGFVHGVGEKRFEPDEYMYTGAACKVVLAALGYDKLASVNGGYLEGYIRTAAELELIKYVPSDSILTRGEMFLMIFETLKTPMYNAKTFKGNAAVLEVDKEETFLKAYHNAKYGKGIVDGVQQSSFNDINLLEGEVDISGEVYTTRISLDDMLGEEIEYVAYMDEDWTDGELAVALRTGKTDVIYISEKDFIEFDKAEYRLSYVNENERVKSIKLERDLRLIYNGGVIESDISSRLNDGCDLKIIEGKNGNDRVVAKKKYDIVVKSVDAAGETITNMAGSPKVLELGHNRRSVVIKKDGETDMTLDKLASGDVISVYESYHKLPEETGEYIELVVSTSRVTGTVEGVEEDDGEKWITMDEIEYLDLSGATYKFGDNVELYLDTDGDVAYVEVIPSTDFAAYLISAKVLPDHEVYDTVLYIKLLKQDGEVTKLYCKEKLKIDETRLKDAYDAYDLLTDSKTGEFKPQLVLIKTDAEGLISSIDTTGGRHDEGTLRSTLYKEYVMYKGVGYLGKTNTDVLAIDSTTVAFRIPTEDMLKNGEADDSDYGVGISGYIGDNDWVTASTYMTTDDKAGIQEYMVLEMKGQASSIPWPILVEKVTSVYDEEEDEILSMVTGYDGYTKQSFAVNEDADWKKKGSAWAEGSVSALKPGMVISTVKNSKGKAIEVNIVYDPNNRAEYYNSGDYNAMQNEVGIAEDASDKVLVMTVGDRSIAVKAEAAEIMVYDDDNVIRKGSFADAKLYEDSNNKNNPDTYSDVVVFQYQRWARRVYIFK